MLPLVIEPQELSAAIAAAGDADTGSSKLVLVDLCRAEIYAAHHIPGAIHIEPADIISGRQPAVGRLPDVVQLEDLFSRIGYHPDQHIVVYDDEGGGWAGRFIWTLDVIGHQQYSYLNGGLVAWAAEGLPTTDQVPVVHPTDCSLELDMSVVAEKEDVLASIGNDSIRIWDARSPEEYAGIRAAAARAGHVPGAINLDWLELMDRHNHLRLNTHLEALLADRGLLDADQIITHCQTHHRSGLSYLVGKLLGLNIRAYHGSWSEWGNDPDTPIET